MTQQKSGSAHGDADVVTLVVTMAIKPEHDQDFIDYATNVATKVYEKEAGTVLYVLTKHPTESHTYVWVERYRDEKALSAHMETAYMADAMSILPTWWAKQPIALRLAQVMPR
jgi:quinol monooxygenase YgiN